MKIYIVRILFLLASMPILAQDFNTPTGALVIPHQNWYSGAGAYSISGATMDSTQLAVLQIDG